MRLEPGDAAPAFRSQTLHAGEVGVPDPSHRLTHLQFRRFAGCPVCNFHLRGFARRASEIADAGIREVAVFHSSVEEMRKFQGDLSFDCIADPDKALYRRYGVERSWRALAHPGIAWHGTLNVLATRRLYTRAENGVLGLPADFLIDATGRIVACRYGAHADDHWEIDELLALAA